MSIQKNVFVNKFYNFITVIIKFIAIFVSARLLVVVEFIILHTHIHAHTHIKSVPRENQLTSWKSDNNELWDIRIIDFTCLSLRMNYIF